MTDDDAEIARINAKAREIAARPINAEATPPTLKDDILALAAKDREATIHTVLAALEELDVIRAVTPIMAYDHRIIGAHAKARSQIAHEVGKFLLDNDVIQFAAKPDLIGGGTALAASVVVVLPVTMQVPVEETEVEPMN